MNRASIFEWHKRFKEGRGSVKDDERCGRYKEVITPELIDQIKNFMDKDRRVSIETISAQFDVSVGTVHTIIREELKMRKICTKFVSRVPILVTDYLTKMGIKTVPQPPCSPDLAPRDFCLFPKLRGCRYETIEEMEEAVTKVIDTLTQEDFHGAFQKLLERYNKCIAAGGDYFEADSSFMCVLSIKGLIRKKSGNLSYAPRISTYNGCL